MEEINTQNSRPLFSVVIPLYNEEENIPELYRRLTGVLEKLCNDEGHPAGDYEIILVDDGSTDLSWQLIKELHEKDSRITGLSFSRNFGHYNAITAGIDYSNGNATIIMDGDLQDPPEEIPKLYEKLKEGYDLAYGLREKREDNLYRKFVSYLFWIIFKFVVGFKIPENQTMLRIMNKKYADNFKTFNERNRFLAGLFVWTGFKQAAVKIKHSHRYAGKSKYNLWKMIKLTFNAFTSFSNLPLQLAGLMGLFISFLSFLYGAWLITNKIFFNIDVAGYASIMVTMLFLGGVQLSVLGLMGEYIGRVFTEVQKRPMYILKENLITRDKDG